MLIKIGIDRLEIFNEKRHETRKYQLFVITFYIGILLDYRFTMSLIVSVLFDCKASDRYLLTGKNCFQFFFITGLFIMYITFNISNLVTMQMWNIISGHLWYTLFALMHWVKSKLTTSLWAHFSWLTFEGSICYSFSTLPNVKWRCNWIHLTF